MSLCCTKLWEWDLDLTHLYASFTKHTRSWQRLLNFNLCMITPQILHNVSADFYLVPSILMKMVAKIKILTAVVQSGLLQVQARQIHSDRNPSPYYTGYLCVYMSIKCDIRDYNMCVILQGMLIHSSIWLVAFAANTPIPNKHQWKCHHNCAAPTIAWTKQQPSASTNCVSTNDIFVEIWLCFL